MIEWILSIIAWTLVAIKEWLDYNKTAWPLFSKEHFEKLALLAAVGLTVRMLLWVPFKRHEKQEQAHKEETRRLNNQIAHFEEAEKPGLEIEGVSCVIAMPGKPSCQIRILNNSSTMTADNLRVELLALEDALENEKGAEYFRPTFPVLLQPETAGASTINPGASLKYNLFHVIMSKSATRKENETELVWHSNFVAYFTQETTKNVTQFSSKQSYRLKLLATARDFLKVEREFILSFSEEGSTCRFTLTPQEPREMEKLEQSSKGRGSSICP